MSSKNRTPSPKKNDVLKRLKTRLLTGEDKKLTAGTKIFAAL